MAETMAHSKALKNNLLGQYIKKVRNKPEEDI